LGGEAAVLIVLPSIVSGIGAAFILVAILVDQTVVRAVFLCIGVLLLWIDFFITMAIFRATVRDINGRLKRIEERGSNR
jgi:predicted AlkP superfamily pyrophosphatase or phosphodiesterase